MTGSIRRTDLKIFKPEQQGNNETAGGQRSTNEVENGQLNQVFTSVSVIDHSQGSVEIEKIFPGIDTPGTERLKDAHIYLSDPPQDPLVSCFIVQSSDIDDESRLPQMKDYLESSIVPGLLLRSGLSGMVQYQDLIPADDLAKNATNSAAVGLSVGDVICISTEYTGSENAEWPRKTHFAQVVETSRVGVRFSPGMTFALPSATVSVNGQTSVSKLRATSARTDLKFHGVTRLTAAVAAGIRKIPVAATIGQLLPENNAGDQLISIPIDPFSAAGGIIRKVASTPAVNGLSYSWFIPDFFSGTVRGIDASVRVRYYFNGKCYVESNPTLSKVGQFVFVTLPRRPDPSTLVSISYLSSIRYAEWTSNMPIGGRTVVFNTVSGTVPNPAGGVAYRVADFNGALFWHTTSEFAVASPDRRVGSISSEGVIAYEGGFTGALLTALTQFGATSGDVACTFAVSVTDYDPETFYFTVERASGGVVSGSANASGTVFGSGITGTINSGIVTLNFSQAVLLGTLRYDITEKVGLLPPAELYGFNPVRLPLGGRVEMFNKWGVVVVSDKQVISIPSPATGQTHAARPNSWVELTDKNGKSLWTQTDEHYSFNKATGVVTLHGIFTGFTAPFVLTHTLAEEAMVINKTVDSIELASPLVRSYPINSTVASVQVLGDLQSRVSDVWDMTSWSGDWDARGIASTANLNVIDYPIVVTNQGAVNEEWLLLMTTPTSFRCIGKSLGQIATGDTINTFAPINPRTGQAYFTLPKLAWGGGWSAGEAVRFTTFAASKPTMLVRSVSPGHSMIDKDSITLMLRGNED